MKSITQLKGNHEVVAGLSCEDGISHVGWIKMPNRGGVCHREGDDGDIKEIICL